MKLKHVTPCAECPWRKTAPKGWLGGHPAEYYADAVGAGEVPACHLHDHGPDNGNTAFCAGALACMSNQFMVPTGHFPGQEGAIAARRQVGPMDSVFAHHRTFFSYHTGTEYKHPILRGRKP